MAKITIPEGYTRQEMADVLKTIGVTLDGHPLSDGSYRAYVRKNKINQFLLSQKL